MIAKRAIIIAGGNSIRQGELCKAKDLSLWQNIQNEFTIGLNFAYKFFTPTVLLYKDYKFYIAEKDGLSKLPLVFGMQDSFYSREKLVNTDWNQTYYLSNNIYLLRNRIKEGNVIYHSLQGWEKGFYGILAGILAIHLAICCGCEEIYLLGQDCCAIDGKTHFYEGEIDAVNKDIDGKEKSGVGFNENGKYKTSIYNQNFNEKFEPFKQELNRIKIYNVSPESKITIFPKISYKEFYEKIKTNKQTKHQMYLRYKLLNLYDEKYS